MKIIFCGTPKFSANILKDLVDNGYDVCAVVTSIDKPFGRKKIMKSPEVKEMADSLNIPCFQYKSIRKENYEVLKTFGADIMVTASFGQILTKDIIDIPKIATINVHGSLLPKYRGASPIQWCLINGENQTGITIMRTDEGIDTGDMIYQETMPIQEDDNAETLFDKLSVLGSKCLLKVLKDYQENKIEYKKQGEDFTYYPMLKKENGLVDFKEMSAKQVVDLARGLYVWPNAYFNYQDSTIKIYKAKVYQSEEINENDYKDGEIVFANTKKGFVIKCKSGFVSLIDVQMEGGKRMDIKSFLNGNKVKEGLII